MNFEWNEDKAAANYKTYMKKKNSESSEENDMRPISRAVFVESITKHIVKDTV